MEKIITTETIFGHKVESERIDFKEEDLTEIINLNSDDLVRWLYLENNKLQQQIDAITLSLEPAIVIDNMELNARVEELEAQVGDLVSAVELLLKRV